MATVTFFLLQLMISSTLGAELLSVKGNLASQGVTLNGHFANFAVDGNLTTYALSASPYVPVNMAWWYVVLGKTYPVESVQVWNGFNFDNGISYSLENFEIFIITSGSDILPCYTYSSASFNLGESKTFPCANAPLSGSSVYFKKLPGGLRNELAIAEVAVYVSSSTRTVQVLKARQSATLVLFTADLAVDGNIMTYSVALATGGLRFAWWMADLGSNYRITSLRLTAGPDYTNAQYLQSVSIEVSSYTVEEDPTFNMSVNCNSRSSVQLILPFTALNFNCGTSPTGRYVIIRRIYDSTYRPDIICLAEVLIEGQKI